jgi:hypothetical protein
MLSATFKFQGLLLVSEQQLIHVFSSSMFDKHDFWEEAQKLKSILHYRIHSCSACRRHAPSTFNWETRKLDV